jgi:tetratricopeptide (TPR) repeat protein
MVQRHLQRQLIAALLLLLALGGCVPPRGAETDPSQDESLPAVQSLLESAHAARAEGRLDDAAASLERALRLQPENAALWHELAQLRNDQGQWEQAISSAQRSNSYAGAALARENWLLIAQCRRALGDEEGALEAEQRAEDGS